VARTPTHVIFLLLADGVKGMRPADKLLGSFVAGAAATFLLWALLSRQRGRLASPPQRKRRVELLLHNVAKPRNIDNAVRCAAALGVDRIVLVGQRKDTVALPDTRGTSLVVDKAKYLAEAFAGYGRGRSGRSEENPTQQRVVLVGLEIVPCAVEASSAGAEIVRRFPRCDTVVVVPGNEGLGMSAAEREACDVFVTIAQRCRCVVEEGDDEDGVCGGGAGSLNVNTATAIALHQLIAGSSPL